MRVVSQHRAGENVKNPAPQDTQTRSRLLIGDFGPSDSALAASSGWRLRRTVADRHAARCASRDLCSGGAPRRYSPSEVSEKSSDAVGLLITQPGRQSGTKCTYGNQLGNFCVKFMVGSCVRTREYEVGI